MSTGDRPSSPDDVHLKASFVAADEIIRGPRGPTTEAMAFLLRSCNARSASSPAKSNRAGSASCEAATFCRCSRRSTRCGRECSRSHSLQHVLYGQALQMRLRAAQRAGNDRETLAPRHSAQCRAPQRRRSGRITMWRRSSLNSFGGMALSRPPKNIFRNKVSTCRRDDARARAW